MEEHTRKTATMEEHTRKTAEAMKLAMAMHMKSPPPQGRSAAHTPRKGAAHASKKGAGHASKKGAAHTLRKNAAHASSTEASPIELPVLTDSSSDDDETMNEKASPSPPEARTPRSRQLRRLVKPVLTESSSDSEPDPWEDDDGESRCVVEPWVTALLETASPAATKTVVSPKTAPPAAMKTVISPKALELEKNLNQFWRDGYFVIYDAIPQAIIDRVLEKAETLSYVSIFKSMSGMEHGEYDPKRFQAPMKQVKGAIGEFKSAVKNVLSEYIARMHWRLTYWNMLKSEPDGGTQVPHHDFPGFETGRARELCGSVQAGCMIGLMPNTTLVVYKGCFSEADSEKREVLDYDPGDVVVFRGDLIHGGDSFPQLNYRTHCMLLVNGIKWDDNATELAPVTIHKCEFCPLTSTNRSKIRNHEVVCKNNPRRDQLRKRYYIRRKASDNVRTKCEFCGAVYEKRSSYRQHRRRMHASEI